MLLPCCVAGVTAAERAREVHRKVRPGRWFGDGRCTQAAGPCARCAGPVPVVPGMAARRAWEDLRGGCAGRPVGMPPGGVAAAWEDLGAARRVPGARCVWTHK